MHRRIVRWLPAVVAPALVAGVVAVPLVAAAAPPALPTKTPAQVLELVAKAKTIDGFSGEISQTSDLGLPSLPTTGSDTDASAASAIDLLTGTHRARVWVDGADRSRVAVLDSRAERDVVRDGGSVWLWDSRKNAATHITASGERSEAQGSTKTPAELAATLLDEVTPSTTVAVDTAQRVAGRDAYTLVLTPKTAATTVGHVDIAVDAVTGLPLQVQVTAKGASAPAFTNGFTSIDYAVPAASTFAFTPPTDATVTEKTVTAPRGAKPSGERPTVVGTGWSSIVVAKTGAELDANATLRQLTTAVDGGRVLSTSLVNVLVTDDGRVLAGAVPVSALTAAAG